MTPGAKDSQRLRLLPFGNPALILHGYISYGHDSTFYQPWQALGSDMRSQHPDWNPQNNGQNPLLTELRRHLPHIRRRNFCRLEYAASHLRGADVVVSPTFSGRPPDRHRAESTPHAERIPAHVGDAAEVIDPHVASLPQRPPEEGHLTTRERRDALTRETGLPAHRSDDFADVHHGPFHTTRLAQSARATLAGAQRTIAPQRRLTTIRQCSAIRPVPRSRLCAFLHRCFRQAATSGFPRSRSPSWSRRESQETRAAASPRPKGTQSPSRLQQAAGPEWSGESHPPRS